MDPGKQPMTFDDGMRFLVAAVLIQAVPSKAVLTTFFSALFS